MSNPIGKPLVYCFNTIIGKQRLREARIVGLCLGTLAEFTQLWSVLLPVVLTLVASKNSAFTAIVGDYINSKWALEAFIIANDKRTTTTIALPSIIPQAGLWKH
ncbi:hypothetical protein P3S68_002449 [Capsicum galapagoense]